MVQNPNRTLALLSYLLPVIVPLYIFFVQRRDGFALYHASQSLALAIAAIIVPAIWAVAAWIVTWIPLAGPLLAAASFALVIAAYLVILFGWIRGLVAAAQARVVPVPLFGGWGERLLY